MTNERSGNPSGDDSGDLQDLFPGSEATPREKQAPPPPKPAKASKPSAPSGDEWPSWMGEGGPASPAAAPPAASPSANRPKPAGQNPKPAVKKAAPPPVAAKPPAAPAAPAVVAQRTTERKTLPPKAAARPEPRPTLNPTPQAPASERTVPRRWLRSAIATSAILLALVAGEVAGRCRPETAILFQQAVAGAGSRLPASFPPLLPLAGGVALVLLGVVAWQAGRPQRPLFLPALLLLCLGSAAFGLFRGGHDVDLERSAALFHGRVGSLESELGNLRQKLDSALSNAAKAETLRKELEDWQKAATKQLADKDQAMASALDGLERKLKEQTALLQEAQADRDKAAGSLQQSSIVHQAALREKDEALSALRKEIEELRRKLAEKN